MKCKTISEDITYLAPWDDSNMVCISSDPTNKGADTKHLWHSILKVAS